jgi:hypothetical protein
LIVFVLFFCALFIAALQRFFYRFYFLTFYACRASIFLRPFFIAALQRFLFVFCAFFLLIFYFATFFG